MKSKEIRLLNILSRYFPILVLMLPYVPVSANDTELSVIEMHGFQVDFHLATERQKKKTLASLNKQLEIVESVDLPKGVLDFFRTVPIVVDPELTAMNGEYRQQGARWIVRIKPTDLPRDRPIVLHELLHAYHHQKLRASPTIRDAYQSALQSNSYPPKYRKAHFLENPKEYFAVIGSIYLFGKIDQPPFNCVIPWKSQPDFIAFLETQFGPHTCK